MTAPATPAGFTMGPALLFCPGDRPDRYAKAAERADAVILDLEDAVAPESKAAGRGAVIESSLDPARTIVRINELGGPHTASDLSTVLQTDYRTIMVAKAASAKKIARLDPRLRVIALCETARGVVRADTLAALENVVALMWGAEDLVASLGGTSSRNADGGYRDIARHARSRVLLAAGAAGKAAIDAVHLDIHDVAGLRSEAEDAAAAGFAATACIHPSQAEVIRDAYRPDPARVAWARDVLAAAKTQPGVFAWRGQMVDEPVLRQARATLRRA